MPKKKITVAVLKWIANTFFPIRHIVNSIFCDAETIGFFFSSPGCYDFKEDMKK